MKTEQFTHTGLTTEQVNQARRQFGSNQLTAKKGSDLLATIVRVAKDPMTILLFTAASIYFMSGKVDGSRCEE